MSVALSAIRDRLLDEVQGLGVKFTTVAVNAGNITAEDARLIGALGTATAPGDRSGQYIYVPSAATADKTRMIAVGGTAVSAAGASTLATLTHTGKNTAVLGAVTAYLLGIYPDDLTNLINEALEQEFFETTEPLSLIADAGMFATGTTAWTARGSPTLTKDTGAGHVYKGPRSLKVANSVAADYAETATPIVLPSNTTLLLAALVQADVGTAVLRARAGTGQGTSLSSISSAERAWHYVWQYFSLGTNESLTVGLEGTESTAVTYWDSVWLQSPVETFMYLPSYADARYKIKAISRSQFRNSATSGTAPAFTRELIRLEEGQDYRYLDAHLDANPYSVELGQHLLNYPLWVTYERPWSDAGTLSAETDATNCDIKVIVPRCKQLLGHFYPETFPGLEASALMEIKEHANPRKTSKPRRASFQIPRA